MTADFDARYTQYQLRRSGLRKAVRSLYLRSALHQLRGPTLDFGCGIGELLERLPAGSKGVEYNPASVAHCRDRSLPVQWYDGQADGWSLSGLPADWRFQSMVISHVLEHLEAPMEALRGLLQAAGRRGVTRVLVIVPGQAGFRIDATHRTFVDRQMLRSAEGGDWRAASQRYFPGNWRRLGDHFAHHELQVLLHR